jgi:hypothetical protein
LANAMSRSLRIKSPGDGEMRRQHSPIHRMTRLEKARMMYHSVGRMVERAGKCSEGLVFR